LARYPLPRCFAFSSTALKALLIKFRITLPISCGITFIFPSLSQIGFHQDQFLFRH
jgi:hypothetical protein